jgi:DMSO/TMAO reductase YedYZ molybdopterin-dependent catalytic subunit
MTGLKDADSVNGRLVTTTPRDRRSRESPLFTPILPWGQQLGNPARRLLLRGALSVGALAMLSGCDVVDSGSAERVLRRISTFNDRVQALLFRSDRLAPEYPASSITNPFPFNAYYSEKEAPVIEAGDFRLEVGGLVKNKANWTLPRLCMLPQFAQITRHVCIEGWSAIGEWRGVQFSHFLRLIGADLTAKYVGFRCADNYSTSIDMPTALHPQTQLTFKFGSNILPVKYGHPLKLRVPTKLGYKNPKHITEIVVSNDLPTGFWENYGYNWFSGL